MHSTAQQLECGALIAFRIVCSSLNPHTKKLVRAARASDMKAAFDIDEIDIQIKST